MENIILQYGIMDEKNYNGDGFYVPHGGWFSLMAYCDYAGIDYFDVCQHTADHVKDMVDTIKPGQVMVVFH